MKLITLNIWGGIVHKPLMEFIKKRSVDTDIFCFQEVLFGDQAEFTKIHKARVNIFQEISKTLSEFNAVTQITGTDHFQSELIDFGGGQAIFVKKNLKIKNSGGLYCYDKLPGGASDGAKMTGSAVWVEINLSEENLVVLTMHGLWQKGADKIDTPERIIQSKKMKEFLNTKTGKKIFCGDFNLNPDTQSVALLEEDMVNHIKEKGIKNTRSSFYKKSGSRFADYIFTSTNIKSVDFKVLEDEVSDHLPLFLEFN